jgi:hypothetical protein
MKFPLFLQLSRHLFKTNFFAILLIYLDGGFRWGIESSPVAGDEGIPEFPGHGVQHEHGPQAKDEVLGLTNDLLQNRFL